MPQNRIPIVGLLGGIASGKSFYAQALHRLGCPVISADDLVSEVYLQPEVLDQLRQWWGSDVVRADSTADRQAIARRVFADPAERQRLEHLIHPRVFDLLARRMQEVRALSPPPPAVVWDIPLLLETAREGECDLLVYIDTPDAVREQRALQRGWTADELHRRERSQVSLSEKRRRSHLQVPGDGDAGVVDCESRRILAAASERVASGRN